MPRMVFIHRVEDIARWKGFDGEREANMGAFGSDLRSYVDPSGSDQVAVTMTVTDLPGLQSFLQSETCDAIMRRHGVIRPVTVFAEAG